MASSTRKKSLVTGEENGGKAAQSGQEVPKKTATQLRQEKKVAMEKAAQEEAERISRLPREAKVKALKDAVWNAADGKHTKTGDKDIDTAAQKPKKAAHQAATSAGQGKQSKDKAAPKPAAGKKQTRTKQTLDKSTSRPVLNHHDLSDADEPLPPKDIVVPAKRAPGKRQIAQQNSATSKESLYKATPKLKAKAKNSVKESPDVARSKHEDEEDEDSEEDDDEGEEGDAGSDEESNSEEEEEEESDEDEQNIDNERPSFVMNTSHRSSRSIVLDSDTGDDDPVLTAASIRNKSKTPSSAASLPPNSLVGSEDGLIISSNNDDLGLFSNDTDVHYVKQKPDVLDGPLNILDDTSKSAKRKRKSDDTKKSKKKKKRSEAEARKNAEERPQFKSSKTTAVASDDMQAAMYRHAGKRNYNNLMKWELDYPAQCRIVYNPKLGLNLKDQSVPMQRLLGVLVKDFKMNFTYDEAIHPAGVRSSVFQELVVQAAKKLNMLEVAKRAELDVEYASRFSNYADHRNGIIRGDMKDDAANLIDSHFGLTKTLPELEGPEDPGAAAAAAEAAQLETAARVSHLLHGMGYAYPGDIMSTSAAGGINGQEPFNSLIFTKVITKTYFKAGPRSKDPLATGREPAFRSSIYLKPHEKEILPSIVAATCAAVFLALHDWSTGTHVPSDYSATKAEGEYSVVMQFLANWKEKRPDWYHTFMHRVYLNVCGGHDSVSVRQHKESIDNAMARACPPPPAPVDDEDDAIQ